jgi:hypothetical protein
VGSVVAIASAILSPMHVARADDDAAVDATTDVTDTPDASGPSSPLDASSDVGLVEAPDEGLVEAGGPLTSEDASKLDAAADAPPAYDAGSGLTPLDELPTWGEGEDHNGCSCRLANGSRSAAAATLPSILAMLAWARSRKRRR